jgi:hypothetical protein
MSYTHSLIGETVGRAVTKFQSVLKVPFQNPVNNSVDGLGGNIETFFQIVLGDVTVLNMVDPVILASDFQKKPHGIGKNTVYVKGYLVNPDLFRTGYFGAGYF